jgi:hypothetical protein
MESIPFNGDFFIAQEIKKLIALHQIRTIIETGTWSADSTRAFRNMLPLPDDVITIDSTSEHLTAEYGPAALDDLKAAGIHFILGDSSIELPKVLRRIRFPALLYLDAHGGGAHGSNVNPFLEELDAIANHPKARNRCVICVHDFKVPGKEFGYNGGDWGRGFEPLSYELIQSRLERIYPNGHAFHYNDQAVGAQRGIIYIYPKG